MTDSIPPTEKALREALALSADLLDDIELSRVVLTIAALKASRLARLLNDFDHQQIFRYEAGGYPSTPDGIPDEAWRLAGLAGRTYEEKNKKSGEIKTVANTQSISQIEQVIEATKLALSAATDRDISVSSANPNQFVPPPLGNAVERRVRLDEIATFTNRLATCRTYIYDNALRRHYELKFSGIAEDVFSHVRNAVDVNIGRLVPAALQQFSAIHDNLESENPEDWANAAHSCRRILQAVADALFPPSSQSRTRETANGRREIKLGQDQYINRLVCYVEDNSTSERFSDLVGSHLSFLGDRLNAAFSASQKGSHGVVGRDEANRFVVYTYMIVGDILSLRSSENGDRPNTKSPQPISETHEMPGS